MCVAPLDAFAAGGMLCYGDDTIEIVDTKVSPDLRHATIIYALPSSVPVKLLPDVQRTVSEQLKNTGVTRYLQGALTRRVRSQYAFRLRFVEGFDDSSLASFPNDPQMDRMFDEIDDEIDEWETNNELL